MLTGLSGNPPEGRMADSVSAISLPPARKPSNSLNGKAVFGVRNPDFREYAGRSEKASRRTIPLVVRFSLFQRFQGLERNSQARADRLRSLTIMARVPALS